MVCSLTNFFVGSETDANLPVLDLRMLLHVLGSSDNGSNARLVVGTQECSPISHNNVLTNIIVQLGKHLRRKYNVLLRAEHNVATFIADDARSDIFPRHIRAGVEMRYETDCRQLPSGVGRERCHQVAVIVKRNILQSQLLQFFYQCLGKNPLPRRTRCGMSLFARLRFERDIPQKSIQYCHISYTFMSCDKIRNNRCRCSNAYRHIPSGDR